MFDDEEELSISFDDLEAFPRYPICPEDEDLEKQARRNYCLEYVAGFQMGSDMKKIIEAAKRVEDYLIHGKPTIKEVKK